MLAVLSARSSPEEIAAASRSIASDPAILTLLDAFPSPVMILNPNREIVAFNGSMRMALRPGLGDCRGMRPGEALQCVHAGEGPNGCGTAPACQSCGVLRSVAASQSKAVQATEEYLLNLVNEAGCGTPREYRAVASPLSLDQPYTVLVLADISEEKRRAALERIFYHDLLNSVGALCGLLDLWDEGSSNTDLRSALHRVVGRIREEVLSARDLSAAERGDLQVDRRPVDAAEIIGSILATYDFLPASRGRHLRYSVSGDPCFETDRTLLHRVLENLVRNGLEASKPGQTVMISYTHDTEPVFSVHTETVIPGDAQELIFHRSFSTKRGKGHGIGLYSVRLLTEQYLGGKVSFTSSPEAGTTFMVALPVLDRDSRASRHPSPSVSIRG